MNSNNVNAGFVGPMVPGKPALRKAINSRKKKVNTAGNGKSGVNARNSQQVQTAPALRGNSRAVNVATAAMNAAPYVAAALSNNDGNSSSEDSFYPEDSRGAFPIYMGRNTPITCGYEAKTVVDTITDDFLYELAGVQRSVKQHVSLSRYLPESSDYSTLSNSVFKDQFSNIYDRWTTKIQEIRLNTSMYNFWSISNVYKYIHTVTRALEIYVTLDSILAIDEPVGEVNRVNPVMKTAFNVPEILEAQDKLRRKLRNQWLPVKFRHLILWTYQLYQTADLRQAMQYRFVPEDAFISAGSYTDIAVKLPERIDSLVSILDTQDMTRVRSILRSTLPEGNINSIPAACNNASYDKKHHEIFANQPIIYSTSAGVLTPFPSYQATDDYKAYGMSVNPATDNGFAFALSQSWKDLTGGNFRRDNDFFNSFAHGRVSHFTLKVNQFYAYPPAINTGTATWQRNTDVDLAAFDEVGYIHLLEQTYATGAVSRKATVMPYGYQTVYFNTFNQRLLVVKEVIREMFVA